MLTLGAAGIAMTPTFGLTPTSEGNTFDGWVRTPEELKAFIEGQLHFPRPSSFITYDDAPTHQPKRMLRARTQWTGKVFAQAWMVPNEWTEDRAYDEAAHVEWACQMLAIEVMAWIDAGGLRGRTAVWRRAIQRAQVGMVDSIRFRLSVRGE